MIIFLLKLTRQPTSSPPRQPVLDASHCHHAATNVFVVDQTTQTVPGFFIFGRASGVGPEVYGYRQ